MYLCPVCDVESNDGVNYHMERARFPRRVGLWRRTLLVLKFLGNTDQNVAHLAYAQSRGLQWNYVFFPAGAASSNTQDPPWLS